MWAIICFSFKMIILAFWAFFAILICVGDLSLAFDVFVGTLYSGASMLPLLAMAAFTTFFT